MNRTNYLCALVLLCSACEDPLADCRNTDTCAPLPAAAPSACDGQCVPTSDPWFGDPYLVFLGTGAETEAPKCPDDAPVTEKPTVYAPGPAPACGECGCSPPSGFCSLPTTVTANAFACGDTGTTTPFNPPSAWDGSCAAPNPIQANADCNGEPCVQSVTIGPLILTDACTPYNYTPQSEPGGWTFAFDCSGEAHGTCATAGAQCVPKVPPPKSGANGVWTHCVFGQGDNPETATCPTGYGHRYVFGLSVEDTRKCEPCTCGASEGSTCSSLVKVYTDNACVDQLASDTLTESAQPPVCLPLPAGSALASVSAQEPVYSPGTCQPNGGGMTGEATPVNPVTLCCLD